MIECTSCYKLLPINYFSNSQIKKGERKRCVICIEHDVSSCLKCSACKNLMDEGQFTSTQIRKGLRRRCSDCVKKDRWSRSSYDERKPYKCSGCRSWWSVVDYSGNQLKKGKKRRCLGCVSSKRMICMSCGDSYSKDESSEDRVCKTCQSSGSVDPDTEDFFLPCGLCETEFLMSEISDVAEPGQRRCQDCSKSKQAAAIGDLLNEGLYRKIHYMSLPEYLTALGSENLVSKSFKSNMFGDGYFNTVMTKLEKANEIVSVWNKCYVTKEVRINQVEIWHDEKEFTTLVEPFLKNYDKFNSNTGWTNETTEWHKVMQSLSHFSYHVTKGKYLLCDLQGGIYESEIVLSDPTIASYKKSFGPSDLAIKGMETFFSTHNCSRYCEPDWLKPKTQELHFYITPHTTMSHYK